MRTRTLISIENVLKGSYLGLSFVAVTQSNHINDPVVLFAITMAFLVFVLFIQSFRQGPHGKRSRQQMLAIVILALLDYPATVFGFIVGGQFVGQLYLGFPILTMLAAMAAGSLVGFAWDTILRIRQVWPRRIVLLLLGLAVAAAVVGLFHFQIVVAAGSSAVIATALVLNAICFYVLTFAGRGEETEPEIALICVALALALGQLHLPPMARGMVVILPMAAFVIYCERIRRDLVVFKNVLRGISHEQQGDLRNALLWYRAALARNPRSELAVAGNWRVHRKINLADLAEDDEIIALIDPVVCLERAQTLLDKPTSNTEQQTEAGKLLDIVECRRKDLPQTIGHERLRLLLAAGKLEEAKTLAFSLVDIRPPEIIQLGDHELDALFRTWCKVLQEPALVARGGPELLSQVDPLFSFLAVLRGRLKQLPNDTRAETFKPFVYEKLTLAAYEDYVRRHPDDTVEWLDYRYCYLLADQAADDGKIDRAIEYLRITEFGLPEERLVLWTRLADLHARQSSPDTAQWYERVKELGLQVGPKTLSEAHQKAFYHSVRCLAEAAYHQQQWQRAIHYYQILADSRQSGVATQKILKELYERVEDLVLAIKPVETALQYGLSDQQRRFWAGEKARLYSSITAEQVTAKLAQVEKFFDFGYCFRRAKRLFEEQKPPEDVIRFLDLAALGGTAYLLHVNYLLGRSYYRQGKVQDAVLCLEQVINNRPSKFIDDEQQEAYFTACRLLGDIYLDELNQPEKAVDCYSIYKDYSKSGAETLYRLGKAYEACGKWAHARKWYDMVLVYPTHPRAEDARKALAKLEKAG